MKICFLVGDINKTGGTERVCLIIANELSKKNDVTILSMKNGLNPRFKRVSNVKIDSLNLETTNGFFRRKIKPYLKLKKYLKDTPQDILINVDVILALYSIPMKLFYKIKIVSWEHFNFRINNGTRNRDYARKISARFADCIIVLTDADLSEYKKKLRMKSSIVRIYNPICGHVSNSNKKEKIVLASGRFAYQKNFQELINIWEIVEKKDNEWKLIICGDGDEMDEIKNMIKSKNLNNVILPGFCEDMDEYYNQASVFVMTSRYEGFPMVLLEAQQHSIPLIAYDCFTGPSEIICNNKNGYLIKNGDRKDFANKLFILMNNQNKLTEFSKNSYDYIRKYDISNIIKEWEKLLNNLK